MSDKYYPNDTPFQNLDCEVAFKNLTIQEKKYAHFLSRASWDGQVISFFQTSPESPLIFVFLDKVLRLKPTIEEVKIFLRESCSFTEDDTRSLLVYVGAFLANGGNYRGFGDTKFLPNVTLEKIQGLAARVFNASELEFYTENCIKPMMDYQDIVRGLGFPPEGITTYWSANCDKQDAAIVTEFLNKKMIDAYNQRVFKIPANTDGNEKDIYEIRFPSKQLTSDKDTTVEQLIGKTEEMNGNLFRFTRGDYSEIMPSLIENLREAQNVALNDEEKHMLAAYIDHFETGSLASHKNGSRHWIKDKGPAVETYIGFIETYRDPAGSRAEFEGFAAVVNKEGSKKLGDLVTAAEGIIKNGMPWPAAYEKDRYLKPDFTALDIITFSGSGVPAGINIPNYDEIRQNEGFKNVHLQNVVMANYKAAKVGFLSAEDAKLITDYREKAFEVQVGLHELLGHGSGKLFQQQNGTDDLNVPKDTINPLTNKSIDSWYTSGQSYDSVFGSLSSSYEECRAECIGIYLSTSADVLKIFHIPDEKTDDVLYVNWLSMVLSGVRGLESYTAEKSKWGQAHSQARFVILRVLLEEAKDLVKIEVVTNAEDGKPDLAIKLDRSKIRTEGYKAIGAFLLKLQVYKSTADIKSAQDMYLGYSEVSKNSPSGHDFLKIGEIINNRKKPRTILVQSNTELKGDDVILKMYDNSPEGFAKSWVERYSGSFEKLHESIVKLYKKDISNFPLRQ